MPTLALVAISARMLAEAAVHDGFGAVAIDLFGDVDTRQASTQWLPAGRAGSLCIDTTQVLGHLRELARLGTVAGWVAGSGCEGQPELLAEGARLLPLIGTAAPDVQRVRDPMTFFDWLDRHNIPHPEVRLSPPADPLDWLSKDANGCGGGHVQPAAAPLPQRPRARRYCQRRAAGVPMSATYCANGSDAVVLGFNEGLLHAGERPFVYGGVIGPVAVPAAAALQVTRAVHLLARGMALRGLGSLDFLLDGQAVSVLELNPRPSASLALYTQHLAGGVMSAHVQACLQQRLPDSTPAGPPDVAVRGEAIVFAPRALRLDAAAAAALRQHRGCHDLPAAGTAFAKGDPLCSVSTRGADAIAVRQRLQQQHEAVHHILERLP